jgi:coenzyme PQQ precursor peptide PqqA
VIVGPRADELQTGPARVRFSFAQISLRTFRAAAFFCAIAACARAQADLAYWGENKLGKNTMAWTTPTLVEICIGLEINGYLPAEF